MGSRPTAASGAAGTDGPSFDVAAWVVASCEAQGIPVKVTDARGNAGYFYYNADHKHWIDPLTVRVTPSRDATASK